MPSKTPLQRIQVPVDPETLRALQGLAGEDASVSAIAGELLRLAIAGNLGSAAARSVKAKRPRQLG